MSDWLEHALGRVGYIGPFEYHMVVVEGRAVPHLTATPLPGGRVALSLDGRMSITSSNSTKPSSPFNDPSPAPEENPA